MCCFHASENINKEEIVYRQLQTNDEIPAFRKKYGGETEQNPNDPKYQKRAQEIVFNHMRLRKQDVKKIIVAKVTTQVVSGTITKIKLRVIFYSGKTLTCDSKGVEQAWEKFKHISYSYTCSPTPDKSDDTQSKDVDRAKYQGFAEQSVKKYINSLPGKLVIVEIKTINTAFAVKRVLQQKIMYVNLDVTMRNSRHYICSVVFVIPNTVSLSTECIKKQDRASNNQWADPSKEKYLDFAERSLRVSRRKYKLDLSRHDTIVTFVKQQVVAGFKDTIDFIVHIEDGGEYKCQSLVWERSTGRAIIEEEDVKCYPQ